MGLDIPLTNKAVETLVAASKFGKMSNKQNLLTMAATLHLQSHLQAAIVYWQSVLLRFKGEISGSCYLIEEFVNRL